VNLKAFIVPWYEVALSVPWIGSEVSDESKGGTSQLPKGLTKATLYRRIGVLGVLDKL
jgi:hypothetical protein